MHDIDKKQYSVYFVCSVVNKKQERFLPAQE